MIRTEQRCRLRSQRKTKMKSQLKLFLNLSQLIIPALIFTIVTSMLPSCHAIAGKKIRKLGYNIQQRQQQRGLMTRNSSRAYNTNDDNGILFYDSFLLYRGGDNTDNNDHADNSNENTAASASAASVEQTSSSTEKIAGEEKNSNVNFETEKIMMKQMKEKKNRNNYGKKFNAVGDPNGNDSSSDSESDEEEEEEMMMVDIEEIMRQQQQQRHEREEVEGKENDNYDKEVDGSNTSSSSSSSFEVLMELASRREDMKSKIKEMEKELNRRKQSNSGDSISSRNDGDSAKLEKEEGYEDAKINLDLEFVTTTDAEVQDDDDSIDDIDAVVTDEVVDEEDDDEEDVASYESSSYHLAGTDIAKEDTILKRQRKYKPGSIFKKDVNTKNRKSSTATTAASAVASSDVKTNIDSDTMDSLLISAFQSMLFFPPPMPRLPSPKGSVSLRNIDVSSRRRLDRRTLYHGLLAELGGSHHHHQNSRGTDKGLSSSKKENV